MVKNMLSSLKKPAEAKVILASQVYPFRKNHIFLVKIVPDTIIKNKNAYEIDHLDESMIIDGFSITTFTEENIITTINVFGEHPNVDPDTTSYCIPNQKKGMKLNDETLSLIRTNLRTYYYDSAYFIPTMKQVSYRKLKSMYIQLNEGEKDVRTRCSYKIS
jgi:hypothetical protein